ncbi:RNA polymerase sigma factor for flagellar operon FliA [Thermodesulfitimonas autotrophica]|uniref:RNA polymerase sigma factor for flagellar operon FliA n=1 Tax=Thermodesulfitimonas autotrophica TaxID=1894989 RepID=A0A3N5BIM5_9THEO|nr:sigma-70 family RNA polymerase sigma factor [Thermodesulfitimonas autotrophica]RPF49528.1 RNA polymerase sigma factor for flagellar operon FliA [Thermodesulfitimonas autotrophica]
MQATAVREEPFDWEQLVLENLPYVRQLAYDVAPRDWMVREELEGAGVVALVELAQRYDPSRGVPFLKYAHKRLKGAILDAARRWFWVPRNLWKQHKKLRGLLNENLFYSIEELENRLSGPSETDLLVDRIVVRDAVSKLPEQERALVVSRYFLGKRLKEIGAKFDVGEARASQIHRSALAALRERLEGQPEVRGN